jgi:flagellar hook-length control protein FliK
MGHIVVESNEALRAFERELPVLEKAFKDSGFSETNLEMFLAQDEGNFGAEEQQQEEEFLPQALAASRYDAETERMELTLLEESFLPGITPVNLLV